MTLSPPHPDQAFPTSGVPSEERRDGRSLGSLLAEHLAAVEAERAIERVPPPAPVAPAVALPASAAPAVAPDGWMESAWDDDHRVALAGGVRQGEKDFGSLSRDDDRIGLDDDGMPALWPRPGTSSAATPSVATPSVATPPAAVPAVAGPVELHDPEAVTVLPVADAGRMAAAEPAPDGRWSWPPSVADAATPEPKEPGEAVSDEEPEPEPESVVGLAERLGDDIVDASDVVAEIGQHGLDDDEEARRRYGMSLHGVGVSVLTHLEQRRIQRGARRAPAKRPYFGAAFVRCALYLGPLSVAVAGVPVFARLGWLVPAVLALLGWSAAQALTSVGAEVARNAGAAPAARLVGGGFLTVAGIWGALVWVAPDALLGGSRGLALTVGLGGLATLATVTAALVTRTEADVVRWSLPCWLLGALSVAAVLGDGWAADLPLGTLLPAAIVVAAVRAYRPVIMRRVPGRPRLRRGAIWRGAGHLVLGAGQAGTAVLMWHAGPTVALALAVLPLLLAVPALETLIGWHLHEMEAGLDLAESERDYRRHVRSVAVTTVSALLPPLAAGIALTAAAYRVPAQARIGVLALAAGTLLGGLLAITFLLAARRRTATAASLAAAVPLAILTLPLLPAPSLAPLPAVVAVLAATHLLGLLLVAHTSADQRRPS
ncbi:hypothetical protein [Actinoplanes sp. NBRC 103695]|uniref:hypothetical protein n=1 Tax=Actinoplanes sp. NBRC 103695 TaxID=3032202 RepID=UPI0024A31413|nr:hypothetical protein [Actinoplanes sp. NBRC 103695]GLY94601.1 hypothetical protein Acsp02_18560 [Actinoplanes sp. NBRC 103695]